MRHPTLEIAVYPWRYPNTGFFENINSLWELAQMPQWKPEKPLRVANGFTYFMKENGLKHVTFSTVDGTLEAQLQRRKSLTQRKGVLDISHEILERLEAHLRAAGQLTVTANMMGTSAEEVEESTEPNIIVRLSGQLKNGFLLMWYIVNDSFPRKGLMP
ncbi:ATP phosphoribosyltransferase 2, chloroplastic-like [Rhododendron vialii]|uniref:ATP phosphoribosyltransferase 2, chloroplastic-like n=1 Tax=Rhododendron vialii TaxID=182163 RepID=UPI00265EFD2E|nr:ATP phosphoribosyltransferase 2, chloroplastic-like [Rhododendron vialii]